MNTDPFFNWYYNLIEELRHKEHLFNYLHFFINVNKKDISEGYFSKLQEMIDIFFQVAKIPVGV